MLSIRADPAGKIIGAKSSHLLLCASYRRSPSGASTELLIVVTTSRADRGSVLQSKQDYPNRHGHTPPLGGPSLKAFANGISMHYESTSYGPPVVLIHALGLDSRQWQGQAPALAAAHRVIALDLRGHGQSDRPAGPYSLDQMAEDVYGLMAALGIDSADVVGLSLGGMVAMALAVQRPTAIRRLVLADTTSEYPQAGREQFEVRARVAETHGLAPLVAGVPERWFTADFILEHPGTVAEIQAIVGANDPAAHAAACRAVGAVDYTARLDALRCPTLVIVGDQDPGTPPAAARRLQQAIPGARLKIIERASHLSNVGQPAAFSAALLEFLG
jgi:3-oxoadipate enol-lactonase